MPVYTLGTMNAKTQSEATVKVAIISIWSKIDGLEGSRAGRDKNFEYSVDVPVGATPEAMLNAAYAITNCDDRPLGRQVCATTAGDIMVLDGQHYLVDRFGFTALTLVQSAAIQKLSSRDTSMGFDWLVKRNLIPT